MKIRTTRWVIRMTVMAMAMAAATSPTAAAETAFTYQGQLKQDGVPITGSADLEFRLWDEAGSGEPPTGGSQVGPTLTFDGLGGNPAPVDVVNGLFTVQLDFGNGAFTGDARWLEIVVTYPSGGGVPISLSPRQPITPAPYALALPGLWAQHNATSPNLIGGHQDNMVTVDVTAATISGGGMDGMTNRVTDRGGTVGGGMDNQAGDDAGTTLDTRDATVAGGSGNTASGLQSAVGGGLNNTASESYSTVAGGYLNRALGGTSVVSGGSKNSASAAAAAVAGGYKNNATGDASVVGGGEQNNAGADHATVPGGSYNIASGMFSFAAGQRAQAGHGGSFVWSDSSTQSPNYFASTAKNQFLIKAAAGVGINTNSPGAALHIGGTAGADGLMFPDGTLQTTAAVGGAGDGLWSDSGSDIFYTAGNVGVGTSSPGYRLHVVDSLSTAVRGEAGSSGGYAGHFVHTGAAGTALYAESNGLGRDYATLQVHNTRVNSGMAAYMTSLGSWATMHVENDGTGEVLWLARDNSDSEFIVANNELVGGRVFSVDHDGSTKATSLEIIGAVGVDGLTFADGTLQTTAATGGGDSVWSESGSDIYYNSGKVGIGTSSPLSKLHLAGANANLYAIESGGSPFLGVGDTSSIIGWMQWNSPDNQLDIYTYGHNYPIAIGPTSTGGLFVDTDTNDGNVGIGTSNPLQSLHVLGDVGLYRGIYNTIDLQPAENGTEGALVQLSQDSGTPTIVLDADYKAEMGGAMGAAVELNRDNGNTGLTLRARSGGGGLVQIHDENGDARAQFGTFSTNGAYLTMNDAGNQTGIRIYADSAFGSHVGGAISLRDNNSDKLGLYANFEASGFSRVVSDVIQINGGADLSEQFDVAPNGTALEPGMVVAIDADHPGKLTVAGSPYDRKAAGIISGAGGVRPGMLMSQQGSVADGKHAVALTGRVWTLCDASSGAITPGDLLTTSGTLGHAMKVTDYGKAQGAVIGKAMTSLEKGAGLVLVLVSLQ